MSSANDLSASLNNFLSKAVEANVAPGLIAVAFNREGIFAEAAAGVADVGTKAPMKTDSVVWLASMSKMVTSLATLILVEKTSFDIDSHEALAEIVPELKDTPDNPIWKIFDGKDAEGNYKYKRATVGITLRHLLMHCAGFCYDFNNEIGAWMTNPEGGKYESLFSANISSLFYPRLCESGTDYNYGTNTDIIGLYLMRVHKSTLRQALQDLVFTPLSVPADSLDPFRTPSMDARRTGIAYLLEPGGAFIPLPMPFDTAQFEHEVPEGKTPLTSGVLWGTLSAFSIVARCLLNNSAPAPGGKPLLSPEMWALACKDGLPALGVKGARPFAKSSNPQLCVELDTWSPAKEVGDGSNPTGWSLLQAVAVIEETASGLKVGTITWAGLANSYFFADPESGIGGVISAQAFPWASPQFILLRDQFERWVVDNKPAN